MQQTKIPPTQCPFCQSVIRKIEGGISKRTGKPYKTFYTCSNKACNYTWHYPKTEQDTTQNTQNTSQGKANLTELTAVLKELNKNVKLLTWAIKNNPVIWPENKEKEDEELVDRKVIEDEIPF